MDLQIFRTGDADYGQYVKMLLCGDPGAGKTLTSATFPNPFFASAEGGLMSIANRKIPATKITSSDQLVTLRMILEQEPDVRAKILGQALGYDEPVPVDTLVVDTIDEVARIMTRERMDSQKRDAMQIQDYGWLGEQLRGLIRGFRNLDLHVVFTCHIKETQDNETGRVFYKPAIAGAVGDEIAGYVDLALLLTARPVTRVEGDQTVRTLVRTIQTFPDTNHPWIKDRSGRLPMEMGINFLDDFDRIHGLIFGDLNNPDSEDQNKMSLAGDAVEQESQREQEQAVARLIDAFPGSETVSETETDGPRLQEMAITSVEPETPKKKEAQSEEPPAEENLLSPIEGKYECSDCGTRFDSDNERDFSMLKHKRVLCLDCMKSEQTKRGK